MSASSKDDTSVEISAVGSRLDSWKEIAAYLGRAERTVKRWESDRGLPTHRVPGSGRPSVFAYTAELDGWLKSSAGEDLADSPEANVKLDPGTAIREIDLDAYAARPAVTNAQSSAAAPIEPKSLQHPRPVRFGKRQKWLFAACGLLAAGIALGASSRSLLLAAHAGKEAPAKPVVDSHAPAAVSDAEKQTAHEQYLKGRYEWEQRTPASLNRALDDFTQSIVHDPGDAQAYAGLADTYDLLRQYAAMPDSEAFPRAIAAARKAMELDDSLEEAHRSLAFAEMYGAWDFAAAEKEFKRAIELDPKDPIARRWYANAFSVPGRYEEALKQTDVAQELDPSSNTTLSDKGLMLYNAGRTEEAIALLKEVEGSAPGFRSPHFYLMLIDLDLKDYPGYLAEGQLTAKTSNDPVMADIVASAKAGYARAGAKGLLEGIYSKQKRYYAEGKVWGTILAKTCVLMGRRAEALQLLEDAYTHHEPEVFASFTNPDFFVLKDEPRYQALVKKINFPLPHSETTTV